MLEKCRYCDALFWGKYCPSCHAARIMLSALTDRESLYALVVRARVLNAPEDVYELGSPEYNHARDLVHTSRLIIDERNNPDIYWERIMRELRRRIDVLEEEYTEALKSKILGTPAPPYDV